MTPESNKRHKSSNTLFIDHHETCFCVTFLQSHAKFVVFLKPKKFQIRLEASSDTGDGNGAEQVYSPSWVGSPCHGYESGQIDFV